MDEIIVRKATVNDLDSIISIAKQSQLSYWKKEDYAVEISKSESLFLVAEIERRIIGFILTRFNLLPVGAPPQDGYATGDIINIGVLDRFRDRGIGGRLLEIIIARAQILDAREIWLEVRASNDNARRFYRRNGFVEIQKRRNFYTHPTEDAVLMKRLVNEEFATDGKPSEPFVV